ncbi:UNVERIFIED_CONTAM: hypothetical protein Slati_3651700 [Sesamum latifolium]|uniref:Retrotransposon Copia-like N-terminal domain-containing protein n=1 Tax=Sesamum latifolium TaxID=2727402 RepID=A0AAW2U030_9LAMI
MATGSGDLTENRGATKPKVSELLELLSSDHPGMVLVSTPLNGRNYMGWSRAMRIALGAKMKLGFITGKCVRPDENSDDFEKWMRVDCMVTLWLLNSISKDIVDAFLYIASAHELWAELEQRFGECSGPLLYQIQREIASISQAPVPHCNCEYTRTVIDYATSHQLMQFLMGLNDIYDHVRNQILVTEPLPNVNKAYSMILRVEKQRQYKDLTEQRKKDGTGGRVFNVQTDENRTATEAHSTSDVASVSETVRMELMKLMRSLAPAEQQPETRSDDYAEHKCVFIGYSSGQKAFKLYDLNNHSVIIYKDVIFHEQNFPFSTYTLPDLTATPLPLVSLTDDPIILSNPSPQLTSIPEQSHPPHSTSTNPNFPSSFSEQSPSPPHILSSSLPSPTFPIRRSTRQSQKPPWMSDFVCNHSSSFTNAHMSFVGHLSVLQEPSTFSQVQQHAEWREAMKHELTALEKNHTW